MTAQTSAGDNLEVSHSPFAGNTDSTNLSTSLPTSCVESAQETGPADTDPDSSEDVIVHQRNVAAGYVGYSGPAVRSHDA